MTQSAIDLEHLSWPEVRARIDDGYRTAVFACGAVEQHGPHLPLLVDAEHGTALARAVAKKLGRALVAPTVRVGCSDHHLAFAGTVSIRASTFVALLEDYCSSLVRHGFERICIVPTHGGNYGPLADALPGLDAGCDGARVEAFTDLRGLMRLWRDVVHKMTGLGGRVGGHADIAETALMLALHPELVRPERAEPGLLLDPETADFTGLIAGGFDQATPNGILGDPRGATAALGLELLDALAGYVVSSLETGGVPPP